VDPPPVSLTLDTRHTNAGGNTTTVVQRISRGRDHVHVSVPADGHEWLFEQNSVDPRRVSAVFVDHRNRMVVEYDESHLRREQGITGWAAVAAFRLEPAAIAALREGVERTVTVTLGSVTFEERQAGAEFASSLRRLAWNDELAAPASYELRDGRTRMRAAASALELAVDEQLFQPPARRFPDYVVRDVADWREAQ
jgi:hypothetical protein